MRGLLTSLIALCGALPLASWAARPVRVYEVDLDAQSATAVQDAMRQALVRATGRRESADDPALAGLITDAAKYVQSYASGPRGEPQVVFDGAALGRAIGAAGRTAWDRERPFTLVVLYPPPERAAADAARAELEHAASERGLPISVIPLAVVDGSGNTLAGNVLVQAAQRYGADEILVGRADAPAPPGQLQWTLYTRIATQSWTGPLTAGIEHTVDLLAPPPGAAPAQGEVPTRVRVEGVAGLSDYAAIERMLQSVPGVRRAEVAEVDAGSVTFEVELRGGAAALERELAGSSRLARSAAGPNRLVYRYQPQG
ncbi:MAG: DUF2066 domain-containing protein [Steroidobacteraceae bacterium]